MLRLRLTFLALLVSMALFFNIERLDLGIENTININTFAYILGLTYVLAILSLPKLLAVNVQLTTISGVGLYLISKLLIPTHHPMLGGIYTYVAITELAFVTVIAWLAARVSSELYSFHTAVENITLSEIGMRVMPIERSDQLVQNEMLRSRRYERSLSVMVVEPDPTAIAHNLTELVKKLQKTIMARFVMTSLANILGKVVRRPDLIMEQTGKNRFVILCPETPSANSAILVDRIHEAVTQEFDLPILWGIAEFPSEGVTFRELIRKATSRLARHPGCPPPSEPQEPRT